MLWSVEGTQPCHRGWAPTTAFRKPNKAALTRFMRSGGPALQLLRNGASASHTGEEAAQSNEAFRYEQHQVRVPDERLQRAQQTACREHGHAVGLRHRPSKVLR